MAADEAADEAKARAAAEDTPEARAKAKEAAAKQLDEEAAKSALPQFSSLRGGTLGMPSWADSEGLSAALDAQIAGGDVNVNAFAKMGGLEITRRLRVDLVAETFEESIPRSIVGTAPATTELVVAKVSAGGLRIRFDRRPVFHVSVLQTEVCAEALARVSLENLKRLNQITALSIEERGRKLAEDKPLSSEEQKRLVEKDDLALSADAKNAVKLCDLKRIHGTSTFSFWGGVRVLRRASTEADGKDSIGFAAELAIQRERYYGSGTDLGWHIAPSFLFLPGVEDKGPDTMIRFPDLYELRISAGLEVRGDTVKGKNVAPRLGIYANASWNWWHNEFNFGSVEEDIRGFQYEGGLYVGGRFSGGFQGIFSIAALRPFGDEGMQFILSFKPSASSSGTAPPLPLPPAAAGKTEAEAAAAAKTEAAAAAAAEKTPTLTPATGTAPAVISPGGS